MTTPVILDRAAILAAKDRADITQVRVSAWGGSVHIKRISAATRDRFEACLIDGARRHLARATMIAGGVCDASGRLLFGPDDVPALAEKSAAAIDEIFDTIRTHSKLEEEAVEDAAGKSDETP